MLASMAKPAQRSIRKQRERKIFLDLLRELRKQKGLTQGQVAKGIGEPFVTSIPRESLLMTLGSTRSAVQARISLAPKH